MGHVTTVLGSISAWWKGWTVSFVCVLVVVGANMYCPSQTTRVCDPAPSTQGSESHDSPTTIYQNDSISEPMTNELGFGMKESRFRIDRKKLEDMLQVQPAEASAKGTENAEDFFQKVMVKTSTQISWPSKLKIGAKSKKDPHVKIIGRPEAVLAAKDMILEVLDTKKNRVTLKMDVSHSDHSYIIGKGGFKIQQVMEETGCHIHFPDSNRNSAAEKSNQVSIAGQAEGVELARCKIRELLPLVFMFELPANVRLNVGDEASPAIQHIQQTYSFNIALRPLGVGKATLMIVRGCQRHLPRLRQGLMLLMEYLTGSKSTQVHGFMKTEIAPQHHPFVMGVCGSNIQMVMSKTGAVISFPDANLSRLSNAPQGSQILQSKSTIVIQGSFDSVCLAWQELLKCLPLILMFDLGEGQDINTVLINHVMETFNISIMIRPKVKENTKSVLLRGAERDTKLLFKVRRQILGLNSVENNTSCCGKYVQSLASDVLTAKVDVPLKFPCEKENITLGFEKDGRELSNLIVNNLSLLTGMINQNPQLLTMLNSPVTVPTNNPNFLSLLLSVSSQLQNALIQAQNSGLRSDLPPKSNQHIDKGAAAENGWLPKSQDKLGHDRNFQSYSNSSNFKHSDDVDSGIFPLNDSSRNSCDSRSDLSSQPDITSETDQKATFYGQSKETQSDLVELLAEFESKKILATKMMQKAVGEGVRTPTNVWSGYGFSKSMPDFALKNEISPQTNCEYSDSGSANLSNVSAQSWVSCNSERAFAEALKEPVSSPFSLSNFWENIPSRSPAQGFNTIGNLEQLFSILDLEKYSDTFLHHEIDLSTFLTLSDFDLQQLNISYGARRKMLSAISALRDHRSSTDWSFNFPAAPGAERRALLSRYSSRTMDDC